MQKRKFDELISHFNRKVSDMSIDQKYKMELLGMISAIGFAHENELGTNLAEVGTDAISRQQAIDDIWTVSPLARLDRKWVDRWLRQLPPAEPKRGKWIRIPVTNGRSGHECDQCHNYAPSYQTGEEHLSDFCPNCGAKMVTE